jgi:hypothetical protein
LLLQNVGIAVEPVGRSNAGSSEERANSLFEMQATETKGKQPTIFAVKNMMKPSMF